MRGAHRLRGPVYRDDQLQRVQPGAICPNGMMSVVPFNVMGPT